jgi:hypothetical protein
VTNREVVVSFVPSTAVNDAHQMTWCCNSYPYIAAEDDTPLDCRQAPCLRIQRLLNLTSTSIRSSYHTKTVATAASSTAITTRLIRYAARKAAVTPSPPSPFDPDH